MDEGALRKLVSARTVGRGEGGRNARCARRRHRSRCGVVPVPSGRAESGAAAGSCCGTAGGAPGAPSALFRLCPLARSSRTDIRPSAPSPRPAVPRCSLCGAGRDAMPAICHARPGSPLPAGPAPAAEPSPATCFLRASRRSRSSFLPAPLRANTLAALLLPARDGCSRGPWIAPRAGVGFYPAGDPRWEAALGRELPPGVPPGSVPLGRLPASVR